MPITPPDPGFVGNILQHILLLLGFGAAVLPKASQRRRARVRRR